MSGETKVSVSGWTIDTLAQHVEALTRAQERLDAERDRRYAEVAVERDKALQIEKQARAEALQLAREIQTYKDEKANELREQISSERGNYASKGDLTGMADKFEAQLKPINDYIAADRGHGAGQLDSRTMIAWVFGLIMTLITIGSFVFRTPAAQGPPQIIYVPAPSGTLIPSPSTTTPTK